VLCRQITGKIEVFNGDDISGLTRKLIFDIVKGGRVRIINAIGRRAASW
jgi:hypothetical protein